jgi:hypothetical protein
MATVFLEVVLITQDMQATGLLSRDEVEDPLSDALESAALGEVTGGGGGSGVYIIDVEVSEKRFEEALSVMRSALRAARAPPSTEIRRHSPRETTYRLA